MIPRPSLLQCVSILIILLSGCASQPQSLPSANISLMADIVAAAPVIPREDMMNPTILKDALTNIDALEKTLDWKPFRPGVDIARIYTTPEGGPAAAFLRYQPGASVPLHMHGGYEHIFILKGSQVDRSGENGPGTVVINPPGSSHNVTSPDGCIVLIIWDKPIILTPTQP